jgi:hypothetical protein
MGTTFYVVPALPEVITIIKEEYGIEGENN